MATVDTIMKTDLVTVSPDDTLDDAYRLMQEGGMRHLPVIEFEELVGLLSEGDILLRATLDHATVAVPAIPVREAMSKDLVTCRPSTRLAEAAETMLTCKLACVPVTEMSRLVGIVTASDFLELVCLHEEEIEGPALPLDFLARDHGSQTPLRDAMGS
jgi:acetoin utilization protein AcuB